MAIWQNVKAEIYKRNGAFVGEITKLTHIESVNELDVIGSGSIDIPLNYTPALSLVAKNRVCVVTGDSPSNRNVVIAQFLIQKIKKLPNKKAGILRVSGRDLTQELMFEILGYRTISNGNDGPSDNAIRELLDIYEASSVVNWSMTQWGTGSSKAYLVGSTETIWESILQVTQANKGHVNLANKRPNGTGPVPRWELQFWFDHQYDGSSIIHWFDRLTVKTNPPIGDDFIRPLEGIEVQEETANTITRCVITGAGLGEDMFTFEDATDTPPPGFTFYPSTGLLINTALEAQPDQPRITRPVQFGHIKPEDLTNAAQRRTAANSGLAAGVQFLNENNGSTTNYYEVKTTITSRHTPGQLVTLQYDHTSNINSAGQVQTTPIIDIDEQLVLIRYSLSMDKDRILRASMKLGKTPRPRQSGAKTVVKQVKALETTVKHAKAGASSSSPGSSTPPAGGDYLKTTNSPALAGDLPVNAGVRIDSTDISELKLSDFLLANSSTEAIRGRVLQAINGIKRTDNGAGSTLILELLLASLSGLVISGNELKLGTPGSITSTSENEVTAVSHSHLIESSSNPGRTEKILETDQTGRLQLYRLDAEKLVLTDRATSQMYSVFLENGRLYIESI